MPTSDADLDKIERQLHADGIEHLLVQFVDIHGAAKVKIVPAKALRPVAHEGAGFAGGAVWGSGQGPHSHDLCARIDLDSYTKVPYEPTLARFASDLHVDGKPHPFCPRANLRRVLDAAKFQGYRFNVGIEPEFFLVTKQPDGSIRGWNPRDVDDLKKPCYDYKSMSAAYEFLSQLMLARQMKAVLHEAAFNAPDEFVDRRLTVQADTPVRAHLQNQINFLVDENWTDQFWIFLTQQLLNELHDPLSGFG